MTWNKEKETERRRLYNLGLSDGEIAERSRPKVNPHAVLGWRRARGLPPNRKRLSPLPKEQEELRLDLYKQGLNDAEIAKITGRSQPAICYWRRFRGLPPNVPRGAPGRNRKADKGRTKTKKPKFSRKKDKKKTAVGSLPSKEEVLEKVRRAGAISTEQLIKEGYGDVGRGIDTVAKLRSLVEEGAIENIIEKRGEIIWQVSGR